MSLSTNEIAVKFDWQANAISEVETGIRSEDTKEALLQGKCTYSRYEGRVEQLNLRKGYVAVLAKSPEKELATRKANVEKARAKVNATNPGDPLAASRVEELQRAQGEYADARAALTMEQGKALSFLDRTQLPSDKLEFGVLSTTAVEAGNAVAKLRSLLADLEISRRTENRERIEDVRRELAKAQATQRACQQKLDEFVAGPLRDWKRMDFSL